MKYETPNKAVSAYMTGTCYMTETCYMTGTWNHLVFRQHLPSTIRISGPCCLDLLFGLVVVSWKKTEETIAERFKNNMQRRN